MFSAPQGKLEEAGPLYKRSLDIYERVLGPGHPDVAISLNNLAGLLVDQVRANRQLEESLCSARLMLVRNSEHCGRSCWERFKCSLQTCSDAR